MISSPSRSFRGSLSGIILLAFVLRLVGINFGLPFIYHQDEPIIVNHALAIGSGGWNMHFFIIPPFIIYLLFILYAAYFVIGHGIGIFHDKMDFAVAFLRDPTFFYLTGRFFLGVVFGTATVAVIGRLGKRFFSPKIGLVAALLLTISLIHVQHSHYIYADTPVTFAMTALLFYLLLILKKPTSKNYALLGALLGWGVSMKYTAVYVLPVIGIAHWMIFKEKVLTLTSFKKIILAAATSLAAYAAIAPYTFLDWPHFHRQVAKQAGTEAAVGWAHHLNYSILQGTGILFVILAMLGTVYLVKRYKKEAVILISFLLIYYLVNSHFSQPFARYMMPSIPPLCVLAAFGWDWFSTSLKNRKLVRQVVFGVIVLSMLGPTVYSDLLLVRKDTRTECVEWFEQNVKEGAVVVLDNKFYAPHLLQTLEQVKQKFSLLGTAEADETKKKRLELMPRAMEGKKTYNIYTLSPMGDQGQEAFLFLRPIVKTDWNEIEQIKAEYLIFNYSDPDPDIHKFKDSVIDRLELVKVFSPYKDKNQKLMADRYASTAEPHLPLELFRRTRLGPYLEIYKVRQ